MTSLFLLFLFGTTLFSSSTAFSVIHRQEQPRSTTMTIHASSMELLHDGNYRQVLIDDSSTVLVDACAPWCGPCKLLEPILERTSEQWPSIDFVKYNIEDKNSPDLKLELVLQNALPRKLPSLILWHRGQVVGKLDGLVTDDQLHEFLETHAPQPVAVASSTSNKKGKISFARVGGGDDYMLSAP